MIVVDENLPSFQKEVIQFLFEKIFENIKDQEKKKIYRQELKQLLDEHKIDSIESLLSKITLIAKKFNLPLNIVDDFVRKNYFKATQIVKKQKELLNSLLKNESNFLKFLAQDLFDQNLSNAIFVFQNEEKYILKFPDRIISEINNESLQKEVQLNDSNQKQKKTSLATYQEENSILKEIVKVFPDIEKKSKEKLKEIHKYDFTIEIENDTNDKEIKKTSLNVANVGEEISVLKEILKQFERILKEKENRINQIGSIITKEELNFIQENEQSTSLDSVDDLTEDFEKIPLEIADYLQLRIKLQHFKAYNQIEEYNQFISSANENIKATIGILNIINKENQQNEYLKDKLLEQLANKLNFQKKSIIDLHNRIKKYNLYISFIKQGSQYLKEKYPSLYNYYLEIQNSLLELLVELEKKVDLSEEEWKMELEKKLKILLLFIKEEKVRSYLKDFLINFLLKAKLTILKT